MSFSEIVISICCVILIIATGFGLKREVEEQNYIQTLEEKINIYEQEKYENYCLEDALKQQEDMYE